MKKILVDFDLGEGRVEQLRDACGGCDVAVCTDRALFADELRDAEVLITFLHPITAEVIDDAPALRWIQAMTAGVDILPLETIRGAVSDVFTVEPLPADSSLWTLDNVILTPHICGVSQKYMERGMEIIRHNLEVYLTGAGTMESVVDLARGY